jgi:hypothetical protein
MTKFLNGPAAGIVLSLSRSPRFLRVVFSLTDGWDALDQLEDIPKPNEKIFVYQIAYTPFVMHVDGRDPKTGKRFGRWVSSAPYKLHAEQPDDATARDKLAWKAWCETQSTIHPNPVPG